MLGVYATPAKKQHIFTFLFKFDTPVVLHTLFICRCYRKSIHAIY